MHYQYVNFRVTTCVAQILCNDKARIFLLVDLQEFFFRFRVGGTKKNK